jgi:outer membrane protein assembly factor BamB
MTTPASTTPDRRRFLATLAAAPIAAVLGANRSGRAEDWTGFRGPRGSGLSTESNLPSEWSASKNLAWKQPLPGFGTSSPVLHGDRIYLTTYDGYGQDEKSPGEIGSLRRQLHGLDRTTGKPAWTVDLPVEAGDEAYKGFQALHGYASSTVATDGERLYVFAGISGVSAHALDGKELWRTKVGSKTHNWGSGTSPVLFGDLVIVNAWVESQSLVALDKGTGKEVWRVKTAKASWNTPLVAKSADGRDELVVSGNGELVGFNPRTGERLWTAEGIDDYVCPSAIVHEGIVYAIGARKGQAIAVRLGGDGDVTKSHELWKVGRGSNVSSPAYHDGHLYFASESKGIVYCLKAETGDAVYEERLAPRPDRIYASPLLADGKIYYVSRTSGTFVLAAEPKFRLIAVNEHPDETVFNACPVADRGKLLLRSNAALYCFG